MFRKGLELEALGLNDWEAWKVLEDDMGLGERLFELGMAAGQVWNSAVYKGSCPALCLTVIAYHWRRAERHMTLPRRVSLSLSLSLSPQSQRVRVSQSAIRFVSSSL